MANSPVINQLEQIDQVLQTNLVAPIQISRQAIPRMIERGGGHIVNMSSIAAILAPHTPTTESRAIKGFDEPVAFLRLKGVR